MPRIVGAVAGLLGLLATAQMGGATESARDYSVQISARVQTSPPQIILNWPHDSGPASTGYSVSRKAPGDAAWGRAICLPGTATTYVDKHVHVGAAYEYQIAKITPRYTGYGYIYSGIEVPMIENRGKLLLVVDHTYAEELAPELTRLEQDLVGDGWGVQRLDVSRTDSVIRVKHLIREQYKADPAHVNCVFLLGHVPVPYSGNIAPDGHAPAHEGAWPCDGYYGDMDGVWTDQTVNQTRASDARNHNVPGDGKFDQNSFPAPLRLMVGRVDLANMPGSDIPAGAATFPSELELLRNYLDKDHRFRTRQLELPPRALVGDYFGTHNGEAFAASGWRNLSALLGARNVTQPAAPGAWISTLSTNPCLWAYACGPGTYESIAGCGNRESDCTGTTLELVDQDAKAAFVLLYGSWLGDWDSEDNLLRAVLALPTCGLASAWSGRPHWFLHHMGLGETIGFSARQTQNNGPNGLYRTEVNTAAGQVHIALMGDPTLRLHYVAPPTALSVSALNGRNSLQWAASADPVLGYYIYRAAGRAEPFVRITRLPVLGTSYTDHAGRTNCAYMVRAVNLETSASGSYFNLSEGAFVPAAECPIAGRRAAPVAGPT